MIYYLKLIAMLLACTFAGAIIATIAGYLVGAICGLTMTFYNNNFMTDTSPQGSYLWWANFCGYLIAIFAILPGAAGGFLVGLIKTLPKWKIERRENERTS